MFDGVMYVVGGVMIGGRFMDQVVVVSVSGWVYVVATLFYSLSDVGVAVTFVGFVIVGGFDGVGLVSLVLWLRWVMIFGLMICRFLVWLSSFLVMFCGSLLGDFLIVDCGNDWMLIVIFVYWIIW